MYKSLFNGPPCMNSQMTSQIGGIIHSQSTIGALKCSGEQSMRPNIKVIRVKIVTFCGPFIRKSYDILAILHDYNQKYSRLRVFVKLYFLYKTET